MSPITGTVDREDWSYRVIYRTAQAVLLVAFCFALLRSGLIGVGAVALIFAAGRFEKKQGRKPVAASILGAITPLVPGLGFEVLFAAAAAWCLTHPLVPRRFALGGLIWPLALLSGWGVAALVWWFNAPAILGLIAQGPGGLDELQTLINLVTPDWYLMLIGSARGILLILLFVRFAAEVREREAVLWGVLGALPLALLITLLQLIGVRAPVWNNFTPLWQQLGREPGTFTDPNAMGIVLFLALCLLTLLPSSKQLGRWGRWALFGAILLIGVYSGSRSFVGGVLMLGLFYGIRVRPTTVAFCALLVGLTLGMLAQSGTLARVIEHPTMPISLRRAVEPIATGAVADALFSRTVFMQIGSRMLARSPLFGVGTERFRDYVPIYADWLGLEIGGWSDNSNNFYLGVVAEWGIAGMIFFLLAIGSIHRRTGGADAVGARVGIGILAILLLTGPHLAFDEVTVTAALLCSFGFTVVPSQNGPRRGALLALLVPLLAGYGLDRGFYRWEREGERWFRWSENTASGIVACAPEGMGQLKLRALHPDLGTLPVEVKVQTAYERAFLTIKSSSMQQLPLSCGRNQAVRYRLSVSRSWNPPGDPRMLGVQVFGAHIARYGVAPGGRIVLRRVWSSE